MSRYVPKAELLQMAGHHSEPSEWLMIDQKRVGQFADATNDHQYIHLDPEKASKTPFGGTVAHGFLTLSLLPFLSNQVSVAPEGTVMAINYGLNKVRFPQPVRVGSRVRLVSKILDVTEKKPGQVLLTAAATIEIEGQEKPACVAETLSLFMVG